jgi:hypothetical protein
VKKAIDDLLKWECQFRDDDSYYASKFSVSRYWKTEKWLQFVKKAHARKLEQPLEHFIKLAHSHPRFIFRKATCELSDATSSETIGDLTVEQNYQSLYENQWLAATEFFGDLWCKDILTAEEKQGTASPPKNPPNMSSMQPPLAEEEEIKKIASPQMPAVENQETAPPLKNPPSMSHTEPPPAEEERVKKSASPPTPAKEKRVTFISDKNPPSKRTQTPTAEEERVEKTASPPMPARGIIRCDSNDTFFDREIPHSNELDYPPMEASTHNNTWLSVSEQDKGFTFPRRTNWKRLHPTFPPADHHLERSHRILTICVHGRETED